jgi:hypothetical protein
MKLFAISDLCDRWKYTKAGIHNLVRKEDFPKPVASVCRGRLKLFLEADIEAYEEGKLWLFDENQKQQRQKLYARFQLIENDSDPQNSLTKIFGQNNTKPWRKSPKTE